MTMEPNSPLAEVIDGLLHEFDLRKARLLKSTYSPENFGNAQVIFGIDNLVLEVTQDRKDILISVRSSDSSTAFYIDVVAIWMGWVSTEKLEEFYRRNSELGIQGPYFQLSESINLISRYFESLNAAFSADQIEATGDVLRSIEDAYFSLFLS